MKRTIPLVFAVLALAAAAHAATIETDSFSITVPANWRLDETKDALTFTSPNRDYLCSLFFQPTQQDDAHGFAQTLTESMNGSEPELVPGTTDYYRIEFEKDGETRRATIVESNGICLIITEIGDRAPYADVFRRAWNSLTGKNDNARAFADARITFSTRGKLTVNVPPGWVAWDDPTREMAGATVPDGSCGAGFFIVESGNMSGGDFATDLAKQMNGTKAAKVSEEGSTYTFKTINDGDEAIFVTYTIEGKSLVYMEMGDVGTYWDEVNLIIWNSMSSSDPAAQAMLDNLATMQPQ